MSNKMVADETDKKKMTNGKGKDDNLSPKQKRAFVKMLSKFIRLVGRKVLSQSLKIIWVQHVE